MKLYITLSLFLLVTILPTYSMQEPLKQESISLQMAKNIISGATAGVVEVGFLGHVLSYIINQRIGSGKKFSILPSNWSNAAYMSLSPRHIYKGLGLDIASMAPITALQNWGTEEIKRRLQKRRQSRLTDAQALIPPVIAGGIAGYLVASPTEYLPNYMQHAAVTDNRNLTTKQAASELVARYGMRALLRGGVATGIRDGFFTAGYKTVPQLIKQPLNQLSIRSEYLSITSSILAGVITAIATQPAHVVARYLQNNPDSAHSASAVRAIAQTDGISGLWRGVVPRGARVTIAIPVLSEVEKMIGQWLS